MPIKNNKKREALPVKNNKKREVALKNEVGGDEKHFFFQLAQVSRTQMVRLHPIISFERNSAVSFDQNIPREIPFKW